MAEAFVKTLKRDYARVNPRPDAVSVRQLDGWFEHYNAVHPHKAVGYRSPREFRKQLGTETTENAVGALVARRGRMEGFTGLDYPACVPEAFEALGHWQREGRLLQKEDVVFGLENASRALLRLFIGENFGKQLVKVADAAA
jgi:NADPH-dependent curcumin reductase CurA